MRFRGFEPNRLPRLFVEYVAFTLILNPSGGCLIRFYFTRPTNKVRQCPDAKLPACHALDCLLTVYKKYPSTRSQVLRSLTIRPSPDPTAMTPKVSGNANKSASAGKSSQDLINKLNSAGDPSKAAHAQRFFKTGKGEYAEGDRFLGIRVPQLREISRGYRHLTPGELGKLLENEWHEVRFVALVLLVFHFRKGRGAQAEDIYKLYMSQRKYINNWDLVDVSAPYIPGVWLLTRDRSVLYELAESPVLWDRRIAVLSTAAFIGKGQFGDTIELCTRLLGDPHDLMHKATGWMLREIGKRDISVLREFLSRHSTRMPRTMLRYAIEKLDETERKMWLGR